MRWHPVTGEPTVYNNEAEVPAGHLDHHPDDPNHAKPAVEAAKPAAESKPARVKAEPKPKAEVDPNAMTRKEIRVALDEGGIEYDKTAETDVLAALLNEKVRAVLTEQGREFPENASTKELLGLLSPAE
jgi:hypothetical protein